MLAAEGRVVSMLQLSGYADASAAPREVVVDHADFSVKPTLRFNPGRWCASAASNSITRGARTPSGSTA